MRIGILGPLEVRDAAGGPVAVSGPRQRALVVRLALDPGRAVPADRLIDDLWAGTPPVTAANSLQALVSRLRAAGLRDLIEHGPYGYRLAVGPDQVDAAEFERLVAAARAMDDPAARAGCLRAALALWRGPALADAADAEFATAAVARLDELRLAAVEDRIDADLALGNGADLVPELEGLTAEHPLRERLYGQLMRALCAAGRPADALLAYEKAKEALADRLGVDPSADLSALHLAILRGETNEPGPAREQPERPRRTNLPAQLTSFVGREEEVERVGKLLREFRLVTLTGPGGAGKTRLAVESTARLVDELPDGVWFVPLAPVGDPDEVAQAVLIELGIADVMPIGESRPRLTPLERLVDALAYRRTLIVLDNCEHLLDAAARLADRVLAAAPGVRILATSREPLGITGESLYPVPSLALPPPEATAAEAAGYASVRLFADRAAAVRPGFTVDERSVADIVTICAALDGIPLAIELAAARLRGLSPAQIAARLNDRFRLLSGGSRTAMPRHQTLRAVVEWSWDLLDGTERAVLRRLSAFAGGATPDAAERICALDGTPGEAEVIDVVAALIDKSLVIAEGEAEVRYRLLETVRAFAAERLAESGEEDRVKAAHAAYYLEQAERAEPELRRRDQMRWIERLTAERDNHAAALRHAIAVRDAETGLRLGAALFWFWLLRDMEREAGAWTGAVVRMAGDTPPPGLAEPYAICACSAAFVATVIGEPGPTEAELRHLVDRLLRLVPVEPRHPALVLVRPLFKLFTGDLEAVRAESLRLLDHPDPWVRGMLRLVLCYVASNQGDLDRASREAASAYQAVQALGDRLGMIISLSMLVQLALARGDAVEAVRLAEEAFGYVADGVNTDQRAGLLIMRGRALAELGEVERARDDLRRGIRDTERNGQHDDAAAGYLWLAELDRRAGDRAAARVLLRRALELIEDRSHRIDYRSNTATLYGRLGCIAEQEGDLAEAAEWHGKALRLIGREEVMVATHTIADLVAGLAALASARGEHERAAELLGTAHAVHGYSDPLSYEVKRTTAACREALAPDAFEAAYERGRRATRADALAIQP